MKHVQSSLSARNVLESCFHHCGGPVNLVHACLSTTKQLENSFHHCGGSVMLLQGCLCA